MTPLGDIARKYNLQDQFYADDSQFYVGFKPQSGNISLTVAQIEQCVSDVRFWMIQNCMKLNDDKTELIVFASPSKFSLVRDLQIQIGDVKINQSSVVRDLGVHIDSCLTMAAHVNSICKAAYHQIRVIGHLRPYISQDTARTLVRSLVISRIDYCNTLLYGLPNTMIMKLQKIQNCAARMIFRLRKRSHITPCMITLHWLPVKARIEFKILTLAFNCLKGDGPAYLKCLLEQYIPERSLRSMDKYTLKERSTRTKIGERAFSVAAPVLWNSLPSTLQQETELVSFKNNLKTHYFHTVYEM